MRMCQPISFSEANLGMVIHLSPKSFPSLKIVEMHSRHIANKTVSRTYASSLTDREIPLWTSRKVYNLIVEIYLIPAVVGTKVVLTGSNLSLHFLHSLNIIVKTPEAGIKRKESMKKYFSKVCIIYLSFLDSKDGELRALPLRPRIRRAI